jgi:hypothetical protein
MYITERHLPDVDKACDYFLYDSSVGFPVSDIVSAGGNPKAAVKLPSEYGFGDNAHAAITDFGHKIHYLN